MLRKGDVLIGEEAAARHRGRGAAREHRQTTPVKQVVAHGGRVAVVRVRLAPVVVDQPGGVEAAALREDVARLVDLVGRAGLAIGAVVLFSSQKLSGICYTAQALRA